MGLFDFFRKKESQESVVTDEVLDFLDKADSAYMQAYTKKTTQTLRGVMSTNCISKVSSWVYGYNARYFGSDKFRDTRWTRMGVEEGKLLVRKDVTFGKVRVAGEIRMSVADDYSELWLVETTGNLQVCDIRAA